MLPQKCKIKQLPDDDDDDVAKKYGDTVLQKHWTEIRQSINQKGNDLRKKQKPTNLEKPVEQKSDDAQED